jgi:hypothetical protein
MLQIYENCFDSKCSVLVEMIEHLIAESPTLAKEGYVEVHDRFCTFCTF